MVKRAISGWKAARSVGYWCIFVFDFNKNRGIVGRWCSCSFCLERGECVINFGKERQGAKIQNDYLKYTKSRKSLDLFFDFYKKNLKNILDMNMIPKI